MIVDHTNRRVLEVLESREKAVVVKFLRESQQSGLLALADQPGKPER